jgi:hypothetical protein
MNCGPLSEMIRGRASGNLFGPLQDDLHVRLGHRLTNGPRHQIPAGAVQHRAQVVESAVNIDVRDINMPMLVRLQRLLETAALLARLGIPAPQPAGLAQHPEHAGRTHRHQVVVDHHVSQPTVSLRRVEFLEIQDGPSFPNLAARNRGEPCRYAGWSCRSVAATGKTCPRSTRAIPAAGRSPSRSFRPSPE